MHYLGKDLHSSQCVGHHISNATTARVQSDVIVFRRRHGGRFRRSPGSESSTFCGRRDGDKRHRNLSLEERVSVNAERIRIKLSRFVIGRRGSAAHLNWWSNECCRADLWLVPLVRLHQNIDVLPTTRSETRLDKRACVKRGDTSWSRDRSRLAPLQCDSSTCWFPSLDIS